MKWDNSLLIVRYNKPSLTGSNFVGANEEIATFLQAAVI